MFPTHLILLTSNDSQSVRSLDRLTEYSAKFNQFDRIEVLTLCNTDDLCQAARYTIDNRWLLISYCTAAHNFTIEAEYPHELWESDEFGLNSAAAYSPDRYRAAIAACIEDGLDPDFNSTPVIWEAEDLSHGIYSRRRDPVSGRSGSIMAIATLNLGRWVMEEVN